MSVKEGKGYVCPSCSRTYNEEEYRESRFCRNDGMWLGPAESTVAGAIPNTVFVKVVLDQGSVLPPREQPTDVHAKMDKNVAYFLGVLLSRGAVENNSLIIRIPCESESAPAHREFIVDSFIPRLREVTGEDVRYVAVLRV